MAFKSIIVAVCAYSVFTSFNANAVPTYNVDVGGNVTGIAGLEVQGELWEMTLHDGAYDDLFLADPTAGLYDVAFAELATVSLVNFMSLNQFSNDVSKFLGCSDPNQCGIVTYITEGSTAQAWAALATASGVQDVGNVSTSTGNHSNITFATWTTNANVPEPSITVLLASGLIAFGVVRRKGKV